MAQIKGAILVTGGGRGIGAAVARTLAARGHPIAVNFLDNEAAALSVVADIQRSGGMAHAIRANVASEADVTAMFERIGKDVGALCGLVNNAGISGGFARVDEVSSATLQQVFAVNVIGAFLCSREAVRRLSSRCGGAGGSIVNISSRAAEIGGAGEWVHYAASKGALDTLTIGLAREVAGEGIRVNAIAAGLVDTAMHAAAGRPRRAEELAPTIPIGRPGSADEIAQATAWLMSPAASYVTGSILAVSGGR